MIKRNLFFTLALVLALTCAGDAMAQEKISAGKNPRVILFPMREAVISSTVEATVAKHKFKIGERFQKGDVLSELEQEPFNNRLVKAKAALEEAQASAAFSEKNLARTKSLYAKGIQGLQDVEKSELENELSKSKLSFSEANYKLAKQDFDACLIKAPFAGRISDILVQEHEFVRIGQPVLSLIDDNELLATVNLPSNYGGRIKIGQDIGMKIEETGTVHVGSVYSISGDIEPVSRTFQIKILVNNLDKNLSAGMSGRLTENFNEDSVK